jgi:putative transposase
LRDRDAIYGEAFRQRVAGMGIGEVLSAPSSPWQNPNAERLIGSIRRDCLNHVVVLGSASSICASAGRLFCVLSRIAHAFSLAKDAPTRDVQGVTEGDVIAFREVGGLHHRYERRAA